MSDTPRTDDIARGNHVVPTEWAQELERELAEASEWQAWLSCWGGTPEIVHEFIKGQQSRIHAAQDIEIELAEMRDMIPKPISR